MRETLNVSASSGTTSADSKMVGDGMAKRAGGVVSQRFVEDICLFIYDIRQMSPS